MKAADRRGQAWILNVLVGTAGFEALHPNSRSVLLQLGYASSDFDRVFARVKRGEMIAKAWLAQGAEVERKALRAEREGYRRAASALFGRAGLLYGRGAYSIFRDDPVKSAYHAKLVECQRKSLELADQTARRIEIPFEGKTLYALYHPPRGTAGPAPAVILVPGMDMVKEEWTRLAQTALVPRGIGALALDGPGQGESLLHDLKVSLTNFDDAGRAAIDFLVGEADIDAARIGVMGLSMGAYWVPRIAAADARVKAIVAAQGVQRDVIFNLAQPKFRAHYMYMAGIDDEDEFDRMAEQMTLDDVAPHVACPSLFVQGEFDELRPAEDFLSVYERVPPPKEVWLLEDEFHTMGGSADEYFLLAVDWLEARLRDVPPPDDRRLYLRADGSSVEGDARPIWWSPDRLLDV